MTRTIRQAFVLGAGLGTRLRPLTEELPKPLVPIFQKPLITFAFDHLISAGCTKLVVNTHPLADCFRETFPNQEYRDLPIAFVHEQTLLGTGGGIANVLDQLGDEPFIVYSGDVLTDFALEPLIEAHLRERNEVTLGLRETRFAPSIATRNGRVIDIGETFGHRGEYDFANVSIWNSNFARRIPHAPGSFVPTVTTAIGEEARVGGVVVKDGKWFNIGSPREYLEVHRVIASESWRPAYLPPELDWPVRIAAGAQVDPSAKVSGSSCVAAGVTIGAAAELDDTIVWAGAQIASRTRLRNCIVRRGKTAEGNLSDTVI
ncbi:MAG: sugar phosphate nucleotidyltransferase [Chthoniobacterales bacterium]